MVSSGMAMDKRVLALSPLENQVSDELAARLATSKITLQQAEQLIARALAAKQRGTAPSAEWRDRALEFLRVLAEDK